jgi:hypothetical protein
MLLFCSGIKLRLPPKPYGNGYYKLGDVVKYFPGRFTDSQNWVDYLPKVAGDFGVNVPTVAPFFDGALKAGDDTTNFAVGGATSGDLNGSKSIAS